MRLFLTTMLAVSLGLFVVSCDDSDNSNDVDTSKNSCSTCTVNSGYPCACTLDRDFCDDDSLCVGSSADGAVYGVCSTVCSAFGDEICNINLDCGAVAQCALEGKDNSICALLCLEDTDCPNEQVCEPFVNNPELLICMGG